LIKQIDAIALQEKALGKDTKTTARRARGRLSEMKRIAEVSKVLSKEPDIQYRAANCQRSNPPTVHRPTNKSKPGTVKQRVEENLSLGQEETADELVKIIGVSAPGIRARRDTGKLEEWKLELVPDSNPHYTSELATASIITP